MNNKMICPIVFNTRVEAEIVLDRMDETIDKFGMVTVAELYDLVGLYKDVGDHEYGWTTLRKAEVIAVKNGYELHFPTPKYLCHKDPVGEPGPKGDVNAVVRDTQPHTSEKIEAILTEFEESNADMVNHPKHYKSETGMEVIDVIEAFTFNLNGIEAVDTGNTLKYICRWKKKNGLEDLKKAQWYLNHLIAHVEKMEKEND